MQYPEWPDGKQFAFTIFDDTDYATVENTRPVYDLLAECRLATTKSVWPLKGHEKPLVGGATCEDPEYRRWTQELRAAGFEIGYHLATFHTSRREETDAALKRFSEHFGTYPSCMANHVGCDEAIYWGANRLTGINQFIYNLATLFKWHRRFRGHIEGDPLFWGDLCYERIEYVRNFVFPEINTLKVCPYMPYHDPRRPWVKQWYASSEGSNVVSFVRCISEENQDSLEAEGGACIMYSHLSCDFYKDGKLNTRFRDLIRRLSRKNGWFVPVSRLLDYLRSVRGDHVISDAERRQVERRWLREKLIRGTS